MTQIVTAHQLIPFQSASGEETPPTLAGAIYEFEPSEEEILAELLHSEAFTFGHELSHHYLGHTGCAMQQANNVQQAIAQIGQLLTSGPAAFNQPNEMLADNTFRKQLGLGDDDIFAVHLDLDE